MVRGQIEGRGIRDRAVIEAMTEVPREAFVSEDEAEFAYHDNPLPIAEGHASGDCPRPGGRVHFLSFLPAFSTALPAFLAARIALSAISLARWVRLPASTSFSPVRRLVLP